MSELEDFFSQPIESEPTMGLEEAFARPIEDSNSSEPFENVVSVVSEDDVIGDDDIDELIALYEGKAEKEQESIDEIKLNMKTEDEYASEMQTEMNKDLAQGTTKDLLGSGIGAMGMQALGANPAGVIIGSAAYPLDRAGKRIMEEKGIPQSEPYDYNKHGISLEPILPVDVGRPVKAFNDIVRPTAYATIEGLRSAGGAVADMIKGKPTPEAFDSPASREDYYRMDSKSTSPSAVMP